MYSASSWFLRDIEDHNAPVQRRFLLGSSDYSAQVIKYPTISKAWSDLRPQTVTIELTNAGQLFNFFITDPLQMRQTAELQLGLSYSGNPAKSFVGVVSSGTAQAATVESITLPAGAVETADYYRDMRVRITSGAGAVQERTILASRQNLFLNSELPSTAILTAVTVTDGAALGPFGTMNAASVVETAASAQHQFYRNNTGVPAGQVRVISCYAKALGVGVQRYLLLAFSGGGVSVAGYANFSLDGSLTYRKSAVVLDAGIEDAGNGWYLCWMSQLIDLGGAITNAFKMSEVDAAGYRVWTGDGVSGLLITCMQVETDEVSTYVQTLATAAVGVSVDKWSSNLCGYSEQYNSWAKDLVVVTDNAGLSPVGDMTAELVVPTAVYGQHRIKYTVTLTAGVTYTWSQRLKRSDAANGLHCYMLIWNGTEQKTGTFNLDDVVAGGGSSYKGITDLGDGWFECWMTITPTATAAFTMMSYLTDSSFTSSITGDGVNGLYHWGSQLEVGIGPSEYIKTVGATTVALPDATSVYEVIDSEMLPMFYGTLDAVKYLANGRVSLTLADKFRDLSKRKVGDTTSPVDYTGSAYLIHDLAWYVCTSLAGLSAITSTSNPDIDYASFNSWSSVFSADNVRGSARFTGQQPLEALRQLAKLTQSAVFVEAGRIKFARYTLADSAQYLLAAEDIIEASAILDDRQLVNKQWVSADYDVDSKSFATTVYDVASSSVSSYGLREALIADEFLWLSGSASALNLAQRVVSTAKEMATRFTVKTPMCFVLTTIGDTIAYQDTLLGIDAPYRVMAESIDMDTGTKTFEIDATQVFGTFRLDYSALDGADVLL